MKMEQTMERGFAPIIALIIGLIVAGAAGSFALLLTREGKPADISTVTEKAEEEVARIPENTAQHPPEPAGERTVLRPTPRPPARDSVAPQTILPAHGEIASSQKSSPPIMPPPSPAPVAPAPPAAPPAYSSLLSSSSKLISIEREITVLFNDAYPIGPEHYARLKNDLDMETAGGANPQAIRRPKDMLEAVNPGKIAPTASSPPAARTCSDDARPQLAAHITDVSKIQKITAPGSPSPEGPKGHSFIWTNHKRVPVYMPATAIFSSGAYAKDAAESPAQYLLFFEVSDNCNYQIKFDHIDEPVEVIRAQLPQTPAVADSRTVEAKERIEFKTGDLVGYTYGTNEAGNWDFGLYYMKEKGVLGTQYGSYGMHGYAVCWVDFYAPDKQGLYRKLLEGPALLCSF